ncbi:MAG: hypothetical protein K5622_03905 [Endomicrobiaceae bacterium]|nr:hypothetical protein [Endomicrobiaceae bacterium]
MKKFYYYLTKHCFLTAFIGASAIWFFFSYDNFYERFNQISLFEHSVQDVIYTVCDTDEDFAYKAKEFERIFKGLKGVSVTITNKEYGKLYESNNYKPIWYNRDSFVSGVFNVFADKQDFTEYEYLIKYQYKTILPVALLRVWSFAIIPDYNYYFNSENSTIRSFLKLYITQSIYFWILFFVLYAFLQFYKKELNL